MKIAISIVVHAGDAMCRAVKELDRQLTLAAIRQNLATTTPAHEVAAIANSDAEGGDDIHSMATGLDMQGPKP